MHSGSLSMAILDRINPLDFPPLLTRLLSQRMHVADNRHLHVIDHFEDAVVRAKEGKRLPLQVDGDYVGEYNEIRFRSLADSLTVIA